MIKANVTNFIKHHFISFKLPFRLFALLIILFLVGATITFSYRSGVEIWDFFKKGYLASTFIGRIASVGVGALIGLATLVQSGPVIWNKLSYWGQSLDNYCSSRLLKRKYFLDVIDDHLQEIRKTLSVVNQEMLDIYQMLLFAPQKKQLYENGLQRLDQQLDNELKNVNRECKIILQFFQHNQAYDSLSRERETKNKDQLNNFVAQLYDTLHKNRLLCNELQERAARLEK